jgi:hypothetical protein
MNCSYWSSNYLFIFFMLISFPLRGGKTGGGGMLELRSYWLGYFCWWPRCIWAHDFSRKFSNIQGEEGVVYILLFFIRVETNIAIKLIFCDDHEDLLWVYIWYVYVVTYRTCFSYFGIWHPSRISMSMPCKRRTKTLLCRQPSLNRTQKFKGTRL